MVSQKTTKESGRLREQGRRRRGSPILRWEDCVKRDVKKTGEEGDWEKRTGDRGGWRRIADEAVKKLQASPHLCTPLYFTFICHTLIQYTYFFLKCLRCMISIETTQNILIPHERPSPLIRPILFLVYINDLEEGVTGNI